MVKVVEVYLVVDCVALTITPAPANGNSRIQEVRDIVVGDYVVRTVSYNDPDSGSLDLSTSPDDVVIYSDMLYKQIIIVGVSEVTDFDPSSSKVFKQAFGDCAVSAPLFEPDRIFACMEN